MANASMTIHDIKDIRTSFNEHGPNLQWISLTFLTDNGIELTIGAFAAEGSELILRRIADAIEAIHKEAGA